MKWPFKGRRIESETSIVPSQNDIIEPVEVRPGRVIDRKTGRQLSAQAIQEHGRIARAISSDLSNPRRHQNEKARLRELSNQLAQYEHTNTGLADNALQAVSRQSQENAHHLQIIQRNNSEAALDLINNAPDRIITTTQTFEPKERSFLDKLLGRNPKREPIQETTTVTEKQLPRKLSTGNVTSPNLNVSFNRDFLDTNGTTVAQLEKRTDGFTLNAATRSGHDIRNETNTNRQNTEQRTQAHDYGNSSVHFENTSVEINESNWKVEGPSAEW